MFAFGGRSMKEYNNLELREQMFQKLKELGADLVGTADVDALRNGCSEQLFPVMKDHSRDRFAEEITTGLPHGSVFWEEDAKSVIIYAVAHPKDKPEMDWWCGEINPPGNKKLLTISSEFKKYYAELDPDIHIYPKRYHVERGGIYLKEAALMAGLGCIGKNNLLITSEYGPRVRLRAMTVNVALPPTGPVTFDPCQSCDEPCRTHCPQQAFSDVIYTPEETGIDHLPGRDGSYFRASCNEQMVKDEENAKEGLMPEVCDHPEKIIKYCRNCELFCPVGK